MGRQGGGAVRRTLILIFIIICGMVCGWGGYWIGHRLGWSENAEWPGQIGGGTGAMVLSVVVAIIGIVAATASLSVRTFIRARKLLLDGRPARAELLSVERVGLTLRTWNEAWEKVACDLEVRPSEGDPFHARALQFASKNLDQGLRPGVTVEVRYDPAHPARAAIVRLA